MFTCPRNASRITTSGDKQYSYPDNDTSHTNVDSACLNNDVGIGILPHSNVVVAYAWTPLSPLSIVTDAYLSPLSKRLGSYQDINANTATDVKIRGRECKYASVKLTEKV